MHNKNNAAICYHKTQKKNGSLNKTPNKNGNGSVIFHTHIHTEDNKDYRVDKQVLIREPFYA